MKGRPRPERRSGGTTIECGIYHRMRGKSFSGSVDGLVAALAARQHGVVARWQLLQAGVSARQIELRLHSGRLHQIHQGVYLVGHTVRPPLAPEQAALLACGEQSVLSHRSAANLWGLLPYPASAKAWVTVPPERSSDRPGLYISRASVPARDVRQRNGLRVTSPPRTILDLSALLDEEGLERVVAEAAYRRLASETELTVQIEGNEGRRGITTLRRVLDLPGGPRRTRSPAEQATLRLLRRAGIRGYETNARIHGYEVDLLWRSEGLAVEVDGWDAHSGRVAFERDRLKAATLGANGVTVMPITGRQIRDDPLGVMSRLKRALVQARRRPA
jgi:very-short-patch-repair endonuclease